MGLVLKLLDYDLVLRSSPKIAKDFWKIFNPFFVMVRTTFVQPLFRAARSGHWLGSLEFCNLFHPTMCRISRFFPKAARTPEET
jgi:hypothetical protein